MRRFTSALLSGCGVARCGAAGSRAHQLLLSHLCTSRFFSTSTIWRAEHGYRSPDAAQQARPVASSTEHDVTIIDADENVVHVTPLNSFSEMRDVPRWLATGLSQLKYPTTTDIQRYTIPLLSEGRDVIGLAPTGSGKTVAFAVPALSRFRRNENGSPAVLVLAPTRELVQQTTKVFESLSNGEVRICEAFGGSPRDVQAHRIQRGCDVLVACPGRLKDFLDSGDVSIRDVAFVVFDEADRLLDMGFKQELEEIVRYIDSSAHPQTMMWSATWPESVQRLAQTYLGDNRVLIRAGTAGMGLQVNEHIMQHVIFCDSFTERVAKLGAMVEDGTIDDNNDKLILFVERQTDTESTAKAFSQRLGIDERYIGALHGGMPQWQRDKVMGLFKRNQIRILVATDVASRGLDIPDVTCVINMQAPKNIDIYCHRIGRTGRAGRSGKAYTFFGRADAIIAPELCDYLAHCGTPPPQELKELADLQAERLRARGQRFGGASARGGSRGGSRGGDSRRSSSGRGRGGGGRFAPRAAESSSTLDW